MATADDYTSLLRALLPAGAIWPPGADSVWARLLSAFAEELARVDARADDLLDEADPGTTIELLLDWERVLGLPEDCAAPADTMEERRAALLARLTDTGGQTKQFFIDLAAALGFAITIDEFTPFRVGDDIGLPLVGEDWWFAFRVNAPAVTVRDFRTGISTVGEPLRDWGNELLECAIDRLKPAHTISIFAYA